MIHFRCLAIIAVSLLLSSFVLRAADSAFALPAGDPLAIMALPDGLELRNVSLAVSKALVEEKWENLGWEGNVTTATTKQSHINIKVFALASAADVKFYAEYAAENKSTEEKCRQITLRELRALEKIIAEKLSLYFHKAKGEETVDRAISG